MSQYSYTIIKAGARGLEHHGPANPERVTFEGFGVYKPSARFVAIAVVEGESELWSIDSEYAGVAGTRPSAAGLAELRRYYRVGGERLSKLIVYERRDLWC